MAKIDELEAVFVWHDEHVRGRVEVASHIIAFEACIAMSDECLVIVISYDSDRVVSKTKTIV